MKIAIKYTLVMSAVALLTACGGGGSSSSSSSGNIGSNDSSSAPVASSLTFDVGSALRALTISGQRSNFSIKASNGCLGSGSITSGPTTTNATFEGKPALSSNSIFIVNYTNCVPATSSNTTTSYVDTNYLPLGTVGDKYIVYTGKFNLPSAIKVGDVGIFADAQRYTDNTKTTPDGTAQISYLVEADTASTALITVATKVLGNSKLLESTQLTKYTINSSNVLSLVTLTIQYANGVSTVFTRI
jgi:hypothetical protein